MSLLLRAAVDPCPISDHAGATMGLRLGELTAFLKINKTEFDKDRKLAEQELRATGRTMARDAEVSGRQVGIGFHRGAMPQFQRFFRDANGRLHDERGRFVREFGQLGAAAGGAARGGLSLALGSLSGLIGAATKIGGPLLVVVAILGALAAVAMFVGPALGAVAAALATLPALAFGAAAAIATLVFGFMGLADHFKTTAKAGGSVVDRAYQIVQAERRVRDANKEVLASQQALTRAREDAARQMRDLNVALSGARLDQREAAIRLTDAEKELTDAQTSGDAERIERAQLAYDQARQSVTEVTNRVVDLAAEQQRAAKAGVEGSDQVKAALDRQKHAIEGVQDAEHALAQARRPTGGGAADDLAKISRNAQQFVDTVKALKPAWERLRLAVQDRLFAGVSKEIRDLSSAWLPVLTAKLGGFASTFNSIFKTFSSTARKPEFIEKVGKALDAVDRLISRIGNALAGPFMDAMATLGEAAAPILDMLGSGTEGFLKDFAEWIKSGERSGKLAAFLDKASGFLHDVLHLGKTVLGIVGDITAILFGAEDSGHSSWQSFLDFMDRAKAWLDDPANQKKAAEWIERFQLLGQAVLRFIAIILKIGLWLYEAERSFDRFLETLAVKVARFVRGAKDKWDDLVAFVKGLPGRISGAAVGMFDGFKDAFRSALNWIIDRWNGLSFTMPKGEIFGQTFGGQTLRPPRVDRLADGGLVPATPGGRLARIAEAGEDEAVMPLSKLAPMLRDAVLQALAAAGGTGRRVLELTLDLGEGVKKVVRILLDEHDAQLERQVGMARGR